MALAPHDAAVVVLINHLKGGREGDEFGVQTTTQVEALTARLQKGWSPKSKAFDQPVVAIDAPIAGDRSSSYPRIVETLDGPTDLEANLLISTATLSIPLVINVWAKRWPDRSAIVSEIGIALQDQLPNGGLLRLQASKEAYFGACFTFRRSSSTPRNVDGSSGVARGEFRAVIDVEAEVEELIPVTVTRFREIQLQWQINDGNVSPPIETQTFTA